jgi:PAS domain S-box-containing protein
MLGYEPVEMKQKWTEITHPEDIELTQNVIDHILSGETDLARFTKRYLHRDGSIIWADVNTVLQRDEDGKPLYFISTIQDITQQRQTQQEIMKLNRVYAVISQINEMVVRTREESIILKEACRIAVEIWKLQTGLDGEVDHETERVIPTLWAGEENGYLNELGHISILDEPLGQGPVGTSVRTGKHCLVNDMTQDPSLEPWRESALKQGLDPPSPCR